MIFWARPCDILSIMEKILFLDVDGVIVSKETYFSTRYAREFGVPVEKLLLFFETEFRECNTGKKDMKEVLGKYLADWQWKGSVDELLRYWFEDGSVPDAEVMAIVKNCRNKGIRCYLATDQEKYRATYLWNDLGLAKDFDGSYFSCDLGARKHEALYWEKVLAGLGNPDPVGVSFWDDEEENIEVAKKTGINAHLFTSIEDLKRELKAS